MKNGSGMAFSEPFCLQSEDMPKGISFFGKIMYTGMKGIHPNRRFRQKFLPGRPNGRNERFTHGFCAFTCPYGIQSFRRFEQNQRICQAGERAWHGQRGDHGSRRHVRRR